MVLKSEERRKEITARLSIMAYYIKLCDQQGMTGVNHEAEDFFCGLLNSIFGTSLRNLNCIQQNYPAINLGDPEAALAIQVTSTNSYHKIQHTLDEFFEECLDQTYNQLIVLIIGEKLQYRKKFQCKRRFRFAPDSDIWDTADLCDKIIELNYPVQEKVISFLNNAMGSLTFPPRNQFCYNVHNQSTQLINMRNGSSPKVFVSHSSKDLEIVKGIVAYLEARRIKCWVSYRDLPVGSNFAAKIPDAIDECPFFLLLMSKHSIVSRNVSNELSLALQGDKKTHVLPLQLEPLILPSSYKYHLVNLQIRSYYEEPEHAMEELVKSILGSNADLALRYEDGQAGSAEESHEIWKTSREQTSGPKHNEHKAILLNMAASYDESAKTYSAMEDYTKALEYYEAALEIRLQILPENHAELAQSYSNIGQVYSKLGEQLLALKYLEQAQYIWGKNL